MYYEPEDRFIAYCPEFQAPDESIDEKDLQMLNANLASVLKDFAACLHIRGKIELFMDDKLIWHLGELSSSVSKRHPVFFIASLNSHIISDKVQRLLLHNKKASLIFTSGDYAPNSQTADLLKMAKVFLFNIDECATIGCAGKVSLLTDASKLFSDFISEVQLEKAQVLSFEFPEGTSWENLYIHFNDAHTLTIDVNGRTLSIKKEQMRLGNTQWDLLREFSDGYGQYNLANITGNDAKKKQLERLIKNLMRFFNKRENDSVKPIYLDNGMYQCLFKLKPDWHSTNHHPKKRI